MTIEDSMAQRLQQLTTPFGLLDPETQEALREWEHGVEVYKGDRGWCYVIPCFDLDSTYRARPAPLVPDSINWSHVAPEWKWMARDESGAVVLHDMKPSAGDVWWKRLAGWHHANGFASYRRGTVSWQDSLVQRPEGV